MSRYQKGLERGKIGLATALGLGVGGMIGVAIFAFPGTTAGLAGDLSPIAWATAGVLMLLVGLVYSELATRYPVSGGPAYYPLLVLTERGMKGLGLFLSYLEGVGFTLGWLIAVVVSAIVLPEYLSYLVSITSPGMVAVASIVIVVALNALGLRPAGRVNLALTLLLSLVLLLLSSSFLKTPLRTPHASLEGAGLGGFLSAVGIAMGAYGAWASITAVAGEVTSPRVIPRAVAVSILLVGAFYTLVVYALHYILDPAEASSPQAIWAPLAYAASKVSPLATRIVAVGAVLAILTTMIVGVASIARVVKALGEMRLLPTLLAREVRGEPLPALITTGLLATPLALSPQFFFKFIVIGLLVGTLLPYMINIAMHLLASQNTAEAQGDHYRAPGGRFLSLTALLAVLITAVNLGSEEVKWSLAALGIIVGGYAAAWMVGRMGH